VAAVVADAPAAARQLFQEAGGEGQLEEAGFFDLDIGGIDMVHQLYLVGDAFFLVAGKEIGEQLVELLEVRVVGHIAVEGAEGCAHSFCGGCGRFGAEAEGGHAGAGLVAGVYLSVADGGEEGIEWGYGVGLFAEEECGSLVEAAKIAEAVEGAFVAGGFAEVELRKKGPVHIEAGGGGGIDDHGLAGGWLEVIDVEVFEERVSALVYFRGACGMKDQMIGH